MNIRLLRFARVATCFPFTALMMVMANFSYAEAHHVTHIGVEGGDGSYHDIAKGKSCV
jgi:hypothetical protein